MKIEIVENNPCSTKRPQQGELWWIKNNQSKSLVIVVRIEPQLFNYISLIDGNRYIDSNSLEGLYAEVIEKRYTLTKFTGTATLSNE